LSHWKPFQEPEHLPFTWNGGAGNALLVHGFPGTPNEMRPLAASLHRAGWTVHGLLLPGHGPQIDTLFERRWPEWVAAVEAALTDIPADGPPTLLVGYSFGAALALQTVIVRPPSALVLLAPFWQLGDAWQQWVGFLLKPFFRRIRPFKKADFSNPQVRHGVTNMLPGINLDDPDIQQTLRDLSIPTSLFEQLHTVGRNAYRLAPQVKLPTLIVQGIDDEVVPRQRTHRLLQRFPGPVRYEEVSSGHTMIYPHDPGWPRLEQAVLEFAGSFLTR
jgi:carboxylesterase